MKRNPNEIITERIVAALEAGTIPWRKPWRTAGGLPMNLVSGNPYHGINVWMTIFQPYDSPYWLTFNQCRTRAPVDFTHPVNVTTKLSPRQMSMSSRHKILLQHKHTTRRDKCQGEGRRFLVRFANPANTFIQSDQTTNDQAS